jgi:hypothetical protein
MTAQESPRTTKLYDRMADMIMLKVKRVLPLVGIEAVNAGRDDPAFDRKRKGQAGAVADSAYDALPIHFCNSASGTLRPCSGRI